MQFSQSSLFQPLLLVGDFRKYLVTQRWISTKFNSATQKKFNLVSLYVKTRLRSNLSTAGANGPWSLIRIILQRSITFYFCDIALESYAHIEILVALYSMCTYCTCTYSVRKYNI